MQQRHNGEDVDLTSDPYYQTPEIAEGERYLTCGHHIVVVTCMHILVMATASCSGDVGCTLGLLLVCEHICIQPTSHTLADTNEHTHSHTHIPSHSHTHKIIQAYDNKQTWAHTHTTFMHHINVNTQASRRINPAHAQAQIYTYSYPRTHA